MAGLVIVLICGGMFPSPAQAEEPAATATRGGDRVDDLMGRYNLYPAFEKAGRGAANFFGGWLEIPYNIQTRYSQSDTAGSIFTGAAHGVVRALVRTGVGLYEAVTFFLPYPENFAPILPTLPYYQKGARRTTPLWE